MDSLARTPKTCRCLYYFFHQQRTKLLPYKNQPFISSPTHLSLISFEALKGQNFNFYSSKRDKMESSGPSKRPCFVEEDDGLAFLADLEAGYSGSNYQKVNQNGFFSRPLCYSRRNSLRNLSSFASSGSSPSPRSSRFYETRFEDIREPHFLDACFLCKKPLGGNLDIFMYRGDTPFCSEDCRQEQIEIDEAKEKNMNLSSMKAMRKKDQRNSRSPNKAQGYPFRSGTVAAA